MANRLIDMAVRTSTFGAELITAENASAARVLLDVGSGGGSGAVASVNGQVGAVVLTASDVGAATAAQGAKADTALQPGDATGNITSVNGKTGVVVLTAPDVGAATSSQGAKADTALQPGDIPAQAVSSVNGKTGAVSLVPADLGAATAAQGTKADTAVQPGSLASVATSGSYNSLTSLPTLGTAASQSASSFATAAQGTKADTAIQAGAMGLSHIAGYKLSWVNGTTVAVTRGSCTLPDGSQITFGSDSSISVTSPTANTWYHVYAYISSGAPALEVVAVEPATSPYYGTARTKSGDTSRRYLGSVRTNASAAIIRFEHDYAAGTMSYLQDINSAPLTLVSGGSTSGPAVSATVSAAAAIPLTGRRMVGFLENTGTNLTYISVPELGAPNSNILVFLRAGGVVLGTVVLNSARAFSYSTSTGGLLTAWCAGYTFER